MSLLRRSQDHHLRQSAGAMPLFKEGSLYSFALCHEANHLLKQIT